MDTMLIFLYSMNNCAWPDSAPASFILKKAVELSEWGKSSG